ncbi:MAG: AMP-binding protein, partial [Alphaproteobacteria bacterium]|nr:AMP-binding protein [Alphaproteobacteria bacterium]
YQALRIKILARIEQKKTWQRKLLLKTVDLGMKKALLQPMKWWEQILNILFNITTRPQMKKIFGGHLKGFISGGAPLSPEVGAFISSFGVRVLQGYGMTEASIVVSVNLPFEERMETVGPPIKGVAVKIEKDGEIAVKGKVLMKGYWRDPKGTKEAFDSDGYLKTGDVGALVNGHLVIIDRKKDIIVNNGGENIAPQKIELLLQAQPVIKQAAVYGDHKPYITAVLVVEKEDMKKHGEAGLRKQLQMAIDMANKKLASFERVKKFIVTTDPFTIDNQQLSPTLKLRRHLVLQQYKSTLEKLYR